MSFPKNFDIYEFCTDELKKSLDLGREFDRKQREEEDNRRLQGNDVEMKDESVTKSAEETKAGEIIKKNAKQLR